METGAIIGIVGTLMTSVMIVFGYIITHYLQIQGYHMEKMLEKVHELHLEHYNPLESSSLALSRWIVIGSMDFLKNSTLSMTTLQKISYFLASFLNHRKRLFKDAGGCYIFEGKNDAYYAVELSEEIRRELGNFFDDEDFDNLIELGDADFSDSRSALAGSLPVKTKQAIEELVKTRAKKMEKLLKLYSRILEHDRYLLYGIKGDAEEIKALYEQVEYILNIDEEKEKIENRYKKLKKNCDFLTEEVDRLRNQGYKDNQICTTEYSVADIIIFEENSPLNLFKKNFSWITFVKKNKKYPDTIEYLQRFQYTTKFKYLEYALTKSQELKERLNEELENLYDKEIEYGSTKKCAFITAGIVTLLFGLVVSGWQIELLKIISEHKLQVIGISILLAGICFLSIGIWFPKTIKKKL